MNDLFFWACIGAIAGLVAFYRGFVKLKKKRLIENIPTSKIRSMALGLVEVSGRALALSEMISPFSQGRCVYYQYKVEELRRNRRSTYWATIHSGSSRDAPFYIEDETGRVLVNPNGSEVNIPEDFNLRTGLLSDIPGHIAQFLEEKGVSYKGWFGFNKTLRFTESHIAVNEPVYIMGVCKSNSANLASKHRQRLQEAIRKVKANPEVMKRFDLNNDGDISSDEWELARQTIDQKVRELAGREEDRVYIGKGEHGGQIYYISNHSEKELISNLNLEASLGVFGGAAIFLASLVYVVSSLRHFITL